VYVIGGKARRRLERQKRRRVDNIKMDLGEIGWFGTYWIVLAQERKRWRGLL
jgi:hypothetical protein